jgi:ABC-type glycerol-3-phosphate transport system substrate-binding protein
MLRKEFQERFNWGGGRWATVCSETYAKYADPLYRPMTPEWRQVEEIFGIAMSNVLTGQAEVTDALNEANKGIYQVYKDAGYYSE